ncbi:MAG: protein-glutamate O-methyltransferase CheR [Woeseia sp.]
MSAAEIARLVGERAGLEFPPERYRDVDSALRKLMRCHGIGSASKCLERLDHDQRLFDALLSEVTVGETWFFRDAAQFAEIRDRIIPELRRLRDPQHTLRVWSAGCASGEEPYSLAILFEELGLGAQTRVLGTDVSRQALARARAASYSKWSLRGDGALRAGPWLEKTGRRYELKDTIRSRVEFNYLNLVRDAYPVLSGNVWGLDLVLCRNVLIYMGRETIGAVAKRLVQALATGGYLITAPTDPLLTRWVELESVTTKAGIIYRKAGEQLRFKALRSAPKKNAKPSLSPGVVRSSGAPEPRTRRPKSGHIPALQDERENAAAAATRVRALAGSGDIEKAVAEAASAAAAHAGSLEVAYLYGVLLLSADRPREAITTLKGLLYLDRTLAVAHFVLGTALQRERKFAAALRAFGKAHDIAAGLPEDHVLPLSDGEQAGRFAMAAALRVEALT